MHPNPDAHEHAPSHDHGRPGGHEPIDLDFRPIVRFLATLVVSAVAIHLLLAMQLGWYIAEEPEAAEEVVPLPALKRQPTAEPRLQEASTIDLGDLRRREEAELRSSGWVDRKAGIVRIPIDDAMDLIAAKGLPAREPRGGDDSGARPKTPDAR